MTPLSVLIVDDSEMAAMVLVHTLKQGGFAPSFERVDKPETMGAALDGKPWDVVLCDHVMPEFDAFSALSLLQAREVDLPFIVVSGAIGEETAVELMRAGAHDYVMKGEYGRLIPVIGREMREAHVRHERRQAEAALRQSEARLVLSQRIAKIGSWELDVQNQVLHWSAETFRIFGCQRDNFTPTREAFYAAVHPSDRPAVELSVKTALEQGGRYEIDHRIVLPDQTERLVHEQAELVVTPAGQAKLVGVVQDITERKQLEEQLRLAQKMEAVGQLAGGVAHDFNNILTVIQGHIGLMLTDPDTPESLRPSLGEVQEAARRAAGLTRQLLAFSRRQVLQVRALDLNEVLANVTRMLHRLLGEQIVLEFRFETPTAMVEADSGMMEQVLMNLAVNSRDAMPNGGQILISTGLTTIEESYLLHNPEGRTGQFVVLSVADQGCGMDEETLTRIFEPFFTTKEVGKGTGLGLATVYGIVKQHQGWIEVNSVQGEGTTFRIFLPAAGAKRAAAPESAAAAPTLNGTETILVVEDEQSLRELVRGVLERYGYHVLEAGSGLEALGVWQNHRQEIAILVTDMVMPEGLGGRELAERLQAEKTTLKVIYTSGYSVDLTDGDLQLEEGVNFLPKPYQPIRLAQTVRRCLDGV
jgi:two-component system cell cycle sensor histidine kinase/response regulator CckA